jgi:hypothetical protein
MNAQFRRALKECERWDAKVFVLNNQKDIDCYDEYLTAPQHRAGVHGEKEIIIWADETNAKHSANGLLHELMHLVVWRELGDEPCVVSEEADMLILEYEANRRLKLDWAGWMFDYGVGIGLRWSDLATRERHVMLAKSRELAEWNGLLLNGKPTYRRKFKIENSQRIEIGTSQ